MQCSLDDQRSKIDFCGMLSPGDLLFTCRSFSNPLLIPLFNEPQMAERQKRQLAELDKLQSSLDALKRRCLCPALLLAFACFAKGSRHTEKMIFSVLGLFLTVLPHLLIGRYHPMHQSGRWRQWYACGNCDRDFRDCDHKCLPKYRFKS